MKKIALIFPKDSEALFNKKSSATFGGANVQMYQIGKELSNYKEITTYSLINNYSHISFDDTESFNLIKTFMETDNVIKKILVYHRKLKEIRPDILIQRGLTLFSCLLAIYCKVKKIKFVFMFAHDREVNGRYQRTNKKCILFKLLLVFSHLLVCQSQHQLNQINRKYLQKSSLILSGYEIEEIDNTEMNSILWVGRLEEWKRPDLFLELARLNRGIDFIMIAPKSPGYENVYNEIIKKAHHIPNLEHIDFVHYNKINEYFKKASIFVNTSVQEGFPNTFIQACKNKTPIISLNVNPDHFLDRHSCGFFCGDDFDLMNNNLDRITKDKKTIEFMGENGYKYALENHDIKKNVKKLIESIN